MAVRQPDVPPVTFTMAPQGHSRPSRSGAATCGSPLMVMSPSRAGGAVLLRRTNLDTAPKKRPVAEPLTRLPEALFYLAVMALACVAIGVSYSAQFHAGDKVMKAEPAAGSHSSGQIALAGKGHGRVGDHSVLNARARVNVKTTSRPKRRGAVGKRSTKRPSVQHGKPKKKRVLSRVQKAGAGVRTKPTSRPKRRGGVGKRSTRSSSVQRGKPKKKGVPRRAQSIRKARAGAKTKAPSRPTQRSVKRGRSTKPSSARHKRRTQKRLPTRARRNKAGLLSAHEVNKGANGTQTDHSGIINANVTVTRRSTSKLLVNGTGDIGDRPQELTPQKSGRIVETHPESKDTPGASQDKLSKVALSEKLRKAGLASKTEQGQTRGLANAPAAESNEAAPKVVSRGTDGASLRKAETASRAVSKADIAER